MLDREELLFILGHELGHIKSKHMLYKSMASIMNGLAAQLHRQKAAGCDYLVSDWLTACDLHWACLSLFVSPLKPEDCPMPDFMRDNYSHLTPELAAALDPILISHRDTIFERHIALPLDF